MALDINFIRIRRQELTKQQVLDAKLLRYSWFFLGSVVAVMIIIAGVSWWMGTQLKREADRQNQLEQAISENESVEKTYVILVNKLDTLAQILKLRRDKQNAIKYFSEVFGSDVLVKEIEYSADNQIVSFGLESKNVFVLENVFNTLNSTEIAAEYEGVKPSNLRRNDRGKYGMQVTVTLAADVDEKEATK